MATRPRYTISAKVFLAALFAAFLITISALWNIVSAATKQPTLYSTTSLVQKNFDCDGLPVVISRDGNAPLTMTVNTESGLWIEVPTDEPSDLLFFYNIATSKVAVVSAPLIGGVQTMVLQTYRDIDFYRAHKSQLNLRCKRATHSIQH